MLLKSAKWARSDAVSAARQHTSTHAKQGFIFGEGNWLRLTWLALRPLGFQKSVREAPLYLLEVDGLVLFMYSNNEDLGGQCHITP